MHHHLRGFHCLENRSDTPAAAAMLWDGSRMCTLESMIMMGLVVPITALASTGVQL